MPTILLSIGLRTSDSCKEKKHATLKKEFPFSGAQILPFAHASNILKLPDGSFLCAWFAGQNEGTQDVSIWFSRRENGIWSEPEKISRAEELPHWNPVLFQQKDGTICLFYKIGPNCSDWKTMLTTSRDNGTTFQKELDLETEDSEFSYPSVIADGNRIYVTYTHRRNAIAFCELEI